MNFPEVIPLKFVLSIKEVGWREIAWGYHNGFLGWRSLIEFADYRIQTKYNDLDFKISLLGKENIEELTTKVDQLACMESKDNDQKWFWLVTILAWYFKNNKGSDDALDKVEIVYAHFNYPREIESFVRLLPATDGYNPLEHTREKNILRLMDNWKIYLVKKGVPSEIISKRK